MGIQLCPPRQPAEHNAHHNRWVTRAPSGRPLSEPALENRYFNLALYSSGPAAFHQRIDLLLNPRLSPDEKYIL